MKIIHTEKSKIDLTQKLIFQTVLNEQLEVSYINKNDGKDILCLPTQTSCRMGCTFCFLTDPANTAKVRNLTSDEINELVISSLQFLKLDPARTLLLSFMGSGDPLNNISELTSAIIRIDQSQIQELSEHSPSPHPIIGKYYELRYAVASIIPNLISMSKFTDRIERLRLPVKFHFSMHSPFDNVRSKLIPSSIPIGEALNLLWSYHDRTRQAIEIHYTLISGLNDSVEDLDEIIGLIRGQNVTFKLLQFRERPGFVSSVRYQVFAEELAKAGIRVEIYDPPGSDIGSACGQFNIERYSRGGVVTITGGTASRGIGGTVTIACGDRK